jgi:Zn-dependent protease/predicted transcriptional regulator
VIRGLRVGRIAGIEVRVDWSLAVILFVLTWGLATISLPALEDGYGAPVYWLTAAITSVVFVLSLLAHELAHSLVARRYGIGVASITLWLFGGVSSLKGEPRTPAADFRIAVVGPLTSVGLGIGFFVITSTLALVHAPGLLVATGAWLAMINVVLGIFNLLPGAPLDGGRVLRSALWHRHGDRLRAAISAARAGQGLGVFLVAAGVVEFAFGLGIGGLWLILLGWFLFSAARSEQASTQLRDALAGVVVRDAMSTNPVIAPADLDVDEFLHDWVMRHHFSCFPVADRSGALVGFVTMARLRSVTPDQRVGTTVGAVSWPIDAVPKASPDEALIALLERIEGEAGDGRALVFDADRLVGIITPTDISRVVQWAAFRQETRAPKTGLERSDISRSTLPTP